MPLHNTGKQLPACGKLKEELLRLLRSATPGYLSGLHLFLLRAGPVYPAGDQLGWHCLPCPRLQSLRCLRIGNGRQKNTPRWSGEGLALTAGNAAYNHPQLLNQLHPPYDRLIPLPGFGRRWEEQEIGQLIRTYRPDLFVVEQDAVR